MPAIPTNLFTGFLGVGKSTAVLDAVRRKPAGEYWAVLVNEFGDVGVDEALMASGAPEGVTVREIGGGCVCCAAAPYLPVALHFLLTDRTPDRLIIESAGLGHPAKLIDQLRDGFADRLDVKATVCVVDPSDFARPGMTANPVFVDQVQLADVVVLNKLETASPETVAAFRSWCDTLFPPKLLVAGTSFGHVELAWLDLTAADDRSPLFPDAHGEGPVASGEAGLRLPSRGIPVRHETSGACGWVFHPADAFDRERLVAVLREFPGVVRLKGVFRTTADWVAVNRVRADTSVALSAYRRDSRVLAFGECDWAALETRLVGCAAR